MASTKVIPCISNKAFHILNCAFLILVLMFQSFVLNTFIIWHTGKGDVTSYFWFLGDLLVAGLFVAMTTKSYLYLSQQKALKKEGEKFEPEVCKNDTTVYVFFNVCLLMCLFLYSVGYYWQECLWCASTLLHIVDLLCNFDCHQNCLHLQISNCQCSQD